MDANLRFPWQLLVLSALLATLLPHHVNAQEAAKPGEPCGPCEVAKFDWSKIPPVRTLPRNGAFLIPPSGPGYYSLLDGVEGNCREKPPIQPYGGFGFYQPSFYDTDFRYLEKPDNPQHDFWDPLKRIHPNDAWLLSVGGQTQARFMHEIDRGLTAKNDDFTLFRTRLFADAWYQDRFRIFGEFLYAERFGGDLEPLATDINRSDAQNLFFEVKIADFDDHPIYVRTGRQEMYLGSQRLISALDWANTRLTFQGVRGYRAGEKWDVDLFWVQPVIPHREHFDSVDDKVNLFGGWVTYKPKKGSGVDLYFMNLNNANHTFKGQRGLVGGFDTSTLGSRVWGDENHWLYDVEAALQVGDFVDQSEFAGMCTAGGGYHFADVPFNPQVWLYYDYASGTSTPGVGDTHSTFNQYFPFGHYYFGFLDLVGRRNIHDLNAQAACYPAPWITCLAQFHHFWLDTPRDALYNAAGAAIRQDPTGAAGRQVGNEIDLLVSFHLGTHSDVVVGYSKLFAGRFIEHTGPDVSPELLYVQYGYRW